MDDLEISKDMTPVVTTTSEKVGNVVEQDELKRELKPRHVAMFSIACAIGTGLIIGSGTALTRGGPASTLIAYIMIGVVVYFVMTAIGEMAAYIPMSKGFGGYATRTVDPALGFATGWNYFFKYAMATPTNLTAAGLIIQYWRPDLNVAIWVSVFSVAIIALNCFHVSALGESEFWLGIIKVVVIVSLIICCFVISMGGGPKHERIGFRYWSEPGAFAPYLLHGKKGYFLGWWACVCQACFAYTGTEVVGMTFGEVPNPRKNIPRAVKQTFWRIGCFYILGVLVLGMAVPFNNKSLVGATKKPTSAAASPFVIAVQLAGIKVLPDIINATLLVFVLSASSSDIYCASRSLYGLAKDGQAPAIFKRTLNNGVPIYSVAMASLFVALGYLNAVKSSTVAFGYLTSLVTVFAVLNWLSILLSYFSFRRGMAAQGIPRTDLPYRDPLQPYGSYYAITMTILVVIFQGYNAFIPKFDSTTFVLKYIGVAVYLLNIAGWKLLKGTRRVRGSTMDLSTGRTFFMEEEESAARGHDGRKSSLWRRALHKLTRRA